MPLSLPWKKTKSNRISRIVADLQPASRVVETGFPTSVVDLFVKNRNRIKKHRHKHHYSPLPLSAHSVAPSLSPENSPCLPVAIARVDDDLEDDSTPADVDLNIRANANSNPTTVAAKMFLAVIPALNTQKLALGITLFAFLLFLLQMLGKFAVRFFSATTRRRDGVVIESGLDSEIQTVESNSEDEELGLEEGLVQRESIRNRGKSERSRSARLRSKIMRKLIPKKLRSGKRSKRNKMKEEEEEEIAGSSSSSSRMGKEEDEKMNLECEIMMLMILSGLCGGRFVALVLTVSGCFIFKFIQFYDIYCIY